MSSKDTGNTENNIQDRDGKIVERDIEAEMKTAYISYAMSVIISRALPDVRDGLKPVHRRILFAMNELGVYSDKPHKKSARIVGDVIGKYHPHGDTAVYDALVRMAQPFSMRIPIVDGQGNFGSIDGDSAAAMRYTEARMTPLAEELLRDLDKDTVDFQNNFDDSMTEPTVMPTKIPNLLVNGTSGIAVGMATNMAPHNLSESIDAICAYIDNPEITIDELLYGNLLYNPTEYQTDIDLLMADCTSTEKRYIFEVLSAIKNILRINDWHLSSKHNYDADNPNDY